MAIVNTERYAELHGYARENRKKLTKAEVALWAILSKCQGATWFRQYVRGRYILDFYCPSFKLGIEADGSFHSGREAYDRDRTEFLEEHYGIKLLRFQNELILSNPKKVRAAIRNELMKHEEYRQNIRNIKDKREYEEWCAMRKTIVPIAPQRPRRAKQREALDELQAVFKTMRRKPAQNPKEIMRQNLELLNAKTLAYENPYRKK